MRAARQSDSNGTGVVSSYPRRLRRRRQRVLGEPGRPEPAGKGPHKIRRAVHLDAALFEGVPETHPPKYDIAEDPLVEPDEQVRLAAGIVVAQLGRWSIDDEPV